MLVQELMSDDVAVVSPGSTLKAALRTLAGRRVTALPVVDGTALVGIVSESDVVRGLLEPDPRTRMSRPLTRMPVTSAATVRDVMRSPVVTVRPDDDVVDVLERCTRAGVRSLPVIDGEGHVVGMVSRSDVVLLLARSDADVREAVVDLLRSWGGSWQVEVHDGVVHLGSSGAARGDLDAAELVVGTVPGVLAVEHTGEVRR